MNVNESQYVGCIVGLAVGDALGFPAEFRRRKQILTEIGPQGITDFMYCFWRSPDDFRRAVLTAVNTDGDSDTLGTITGSIVGARLGNGAIPPNWRRDVEDSAYLHALGTRLWQARNQVG